MKYVIYLLLILGTSCVDFNVSDEEATDELSESNVSIRFADHTIGEQNIHYAYTNRNNEALAVFIHGSPGSWNAFIDFFKADSILNEFDLLAIDRPGFGQSGPGKAEPSLEKQAHYINEVTDLFPHQKKILIGHSLGGPVIARMAMDYPSDYHGLVFVAASIDPKMEKDEWYRNLINTKIGAFVTPQDFEVSNDEILPLKKELEIMVPLWKKIEIPCVIIHGTSDSLVPVENVDFAKRMLNDTLITIDLLEDVNHFIPWTHPETITRAIYLLAITP
ncbi:MAG: alpha/beta hydrolase [Bacteroidota bacterium]